MGLQGVLQTRQHQAGGKQQGAPRAVLPLETGWGVDLSGSSHDSWQVAVAVVQQLVKGGVLLTLH
jgi:hypothetical protein